MYNFQVRDAKKVYKELHKSSFPFEHFWNELRYNPKWMEDSQSKKQKTKSGATPSSSNPSTPESVNIEDDSGGLERPMGRKAAKERARKSKSKLSEDNNSSSTYFIKLFEEMKEEKKKMAEKKVTFMEKMVVVEQEKLVVEQEKVAIEQEKVQLEQMKEEQKIMLIDTSVMPPIQAEYFKRLQMEIVAKKM